MFNEEEVKELLAKLDKYEFLENSVLSYTKPLITKYLKGEMPDNMFVYNFRQGTLWAAYGISLLPQKEIERANELYKNEYDLIDGLYAELHNRCFKSSEEIYETVKKCIEDAPIPEERHTK